MRACSSGSCAVERLAQTGCDARGWHGMGVDGRGGDGSYIALCFFILVNMFLAILNGAYSQVRRLLVVQPPGLAQVSGVDGGWKTDCLGPAR